MASRSLLRTKVTCKTSEERAQLSLGFYPISHAGVHRTQQPLFNDSCAGLSSLPKASRPRARRFFRQTCTPLPDKGRRTSCSWHKSSPPPTTSTLPRDPLSSSITTGNTISRMLELVACSKTICNCTSRSSLLRWVELLPQAYLLRVGYESYWLRRHAGSTCFT